MRIVLWAFLTSILCVLINGPSYWWLPFGYVVGLYVVNIIAKMGQDSVQD